MAGIGARPSRSGVGALRLAARRSRRAHSCAPSSNVRLRRRPRWLVEHGAGLDRLVFAIVAVVLGALNGRRAWHDARRDGGFAPSARSRAAAMTAPRASAGESARARRHLARGPRRRAGRQVGHAAEGLPSRSCHADPSPMSKRSCASPRPPAPRWSPAERAPASPEARTPAAARSACRCAAWTACSRYAPTICWQSSNRILNADLNAQLEPYGVWWAPDPASRAISTDHGGNIATGAGGLLCAKYGVVRDAVLGVDLCSPTGALLHLGHPA